MTRTRAAARAATAVVALVAAGLLAGCGAEPTRALPFDGPTPTPTATTDSGRYKPDKFVQDVPGYEPGSSLTSSWVDVDGGRRVECIVYGSGQRGGVSCDWAHPQPLNGPATPGATGR